VAGEMRVEACLAGDSRNSTCGRIGICVQSRYGSQVGLLWKSQAGSDEILHSETGVQFQIGQKPKGCPPSWSVAAVHLFHHRESAPLGAFFAGCISGRVSKWFLVAQPADGGSAPSRLRVRRLCYVWWLAVAPPWAESPIRSAGRRVNILLHVGAASGGCSAHESGRPYRLSICQKAGAEMLALPVRMFASARRFKMLFETDPAIGLDPVHTSHSPTVMLPLDCGRLPASRGFSRPASSL